MAKFPTVKEMAENVADKALDEIEYKGKTLRQWIEIILATDNNVGTELGTNLAEVGTDCISRQAAIDALENNKAALSQIIRGMSAYDAQYHYLAQRNQVVYDIDTIKQLQPIQPEIIRCRECKFASGDSRICMKFDHSPIGELDFCSFAERREVTT